ncbi:MAG: methyltransferase domain-containing protein [Thermodesulfobacteriota bacterium]|nr:methyltransferase domain-containing protein [Thermodesulfobacteriota bacterium]
MIKLFIKHPLVQNLDIDSPEAAVIHSNIIKEKGFLRKIYEKWYDSISKSLPSNITGPVLEIGSGGGFLKEFIPGLLSSEMFLIPGIEVALDGEKLPFKNASLGGIVMIDVFHHIPCVKSFLTEATRCVMSGGVIVMIEPWYTPWSRFVYNYLHHETFDSNSKDWDFQKGGPLSRSNSALPWIVFKRDQEKFKRKFPEWEIQEIELHSPFSYLLSGGVSIRSLVPGCLFEICQRIEDLLQPWKQKLAMFAKIVLIQKKNNRI